MTQHWMDREHLQSRPPIETWILRWMYYKCPCTNQWWPISQVTQHWEDREHLQSRPPIRTWILRWLYHRCPCANQGWAISQRPNTGWIVNTYNHGHLLEPEYYRECITNVHAPTSDGPLLKWPNTGWIVKLAITATYLNLNAIKPLLCQAY